MDGALSTKVPRRGGGRGSANGRIECCPKHEERMGARTADARHLSGSKIVPSGRQWEEGDGLGTANHVVGTEIGTMMLDRAQDECRRTPGRN